MASQTIQVEKEQELFAENKDRKVCLLCKKEIDIKTQAWSVILDFIGKVETARGNYHRQCLKDLLHGKADNIKQSLKDEMGSFIRGYTNTIKKAIGDGRFGDGTQSDTFIS